MSNETGDALEAAPERRVVGHASGWQDQMDTCVCGKPWPCTAGSNEVALIAAGDSPNWEHPKLQALIAQKARLEIEVQTLRDILSREEDPGLGLSDYWTDLHDEALSKMEELSSLTAACREKDERIKELEAVLRAQRIRQAIKSEHPSAEFGVSHGCVRHAATGDNRRHIK